VQARGFARFSGAEVVAFFLWSTWGAWLAAGVCRRGDSEDAALEVAPTDDGSCVRGGTFRHSAGVSGTKGADDDL